MAIMERKYKYDQAILKVYGCGEKKKIKYTHMNVLRTKGIENDKNYSQSSRCSVNDEKLTENISRTKSKIFELSFCNPWQWFFTATLNKNNQDRTDLELFHKKLTQFIRNYNKRHQLSIKFLLIPELHEDGVSWHMHGFLMGLPKEHLHKFVIGDKMGKAIAKKVQNNEAVYKWELYEKSFGWNDLEEIKNHEAVSKYITKYINKNLANSVTELNAHQYYHSRGLNTAQEIKKGNAVTDITPTYENDYCKVMWCDYTEENLEYLKSIIL